MPGQNGLQKNIGLGGNMDYQIHEVAIKNATKRIIAHTEQFAASFHVPDYITISNTKVQQLAFTAETMGETVYRLLYSVYVSDEVEKTIKIPTTWYDHLKDTLLKKFPHLVGLFNINYTEIKVIKKTFFPAEKVTEPYKTFTIQQPFEL